MKKTIAQQLNVKDFPFTIKDSNNNQIYFEDSIGCWEKKEFDSNNNQIYFENSDGYWWKKEYDSNNNEVYFEDSYGIIRDNRPKKVILTLDEIADKFNIDVKDLKVKK